MSMIHVNEQALNQLKYAFETAGIEYKTNLVKLTHLMEEIVNGDIQGEPAKDLLDKYLEKKEFFNQITQTIEEAEDYLGIQTKKFNHIMSDLKSEMD